jgi:integrase/recombinase XerC
MTLTDGRDDAQAMQIIDDYLGHLRRLGRSADTINKRRDILRQLDRALPWGIGQTETGELRAWLYRDDWKQNTRATYYACLRSFYGWAVGGSDPWLSYDPTTELEQVSPMKGSARAVSDEELRRVLHDGADPYRLWTLIAAYQGLRCCELAGLDREHVSEQQLIVVRGKGGRPRAHDTHPDVWAAVKDLPAGPIARTADGRRATPHYISAMASVHFQHDLGLTGVTMHRFRHWLGVNLQKRYKNLRVTQGALGHRSLSSTQIYTDADDSELRAARSTLPRLA